MNRKKNMEKWRRFFESRWYILTAALLLFMAHSTVYVGGNMLLGGYQAILFGGILCISLCVACLLCTDARFLILPLISIICILTPENSPNLPTFSRFLFKPLNLTILILYAVAVVACLIVFMVRNRRNANYISWSSPIFVGLAIMAGSLLLNGIFSRFYTVSDTVFALLFSASMLLIYLLFAAYTQFNRASLEYVLTCVMALGLLITAQTLWAYVAGTVRFAEDGSVIKESFLLGWGLWTTVGGLLAFTVPATLYFAHSKRNPWIYWLLSLLQLAALFLTQSRGALLIGAAAFFMAVIVLCINGKNKKFNRICAVALLVLGMLGFAVLFSKLKPILQNFLTYGFSDNGRFDKWRHGWQNFISYPVFGAGFYSDFSYAGEFQKGAYPYFYHNTFIQFLASGGLVAFAGYLWHRYTTVRLAFRRPNPEKTFMGLCVLSLLMFSMLDVLFFNTYPNVLYAILLLFMEKSDSIMELEP